MANILPFIFIALSFSVIIFILAKKFPQLTLLDVDNIKEVKEYKKKDQLLRKRSEEKDLEINTKFLDRIRPLFAKLKNIQKRFREYVSEIEYKVRTESEVVKKEKKKKTKKTVSKVEKKKQKTEIEQLLQEAQKSFEVEDYNDAEQKFIAIIKAQPKNSQAYEGLADVYHAQNQTDEAIETYKFALKLDPGSEHANVELAEIYEKKGDLDTAVSYYQQAVLINDHISSRFARIYELLTELEKYDTAFEAATQALELEPQNPKYLDNFIESSIIVGDQKAAKEGYKQLRMVNPENKKLPSFKNRIYKMEGES